MKKVLLVINRVPLQRQLIARAGLLAGSLGGRLYVYHGVYDPVEEIDRYIGLDNFSEVRDALLTERESLLRETLGELCEPDSLRVEWCKRGSVAVREWANDIGADLVVTELTEHRGFDGIIHHADQWNLLRNISCPVFLVSARSKPVDTVLAAVDSLDESEGHAQLTARLLDQARTMAKIFHSPLNVLSVIPASELRLAVEARLSDAVNLSGLLEERCMDQLQQTLDELGLAAEELQVLEGRPEKVIVEEAEKGGLLVMGRVANRDLVDKLLGGTSERVLHRATCDVLLVN